MRLIFAIASLTILWNAACATHPALDPEAGDKKALPAKIQEPKGPRPVPLPVQPIESSRSKIKPARNASQKPLMDETLGEQTTNKINWGREVPLDDMITMAKQGEIRQIEWHVMPNIIRALAADGRIFHIRNENKDIDIRSVLTDAGINIGKGGISLRHVF
jgi:hypothetical protein